MPGLQDGWGLHHHRLGEQEQQDHPIGQDCGGLHGQEASCKEDVQNIIIVAGECTLWIRICPQRFDSLMFCLALFRAMPNQTGLAQNVATNSCC